MRCTASQVCVDGQCRACPPGTSVCGNTCVNRQTDVNHCGACGNVCPARPNATAVCSGGQCGYACHRGFADCNVSSADGCETNTLTDIGHCGACGNVCPSRPNAQTVCAGGVCGYVCAPNYADCNQNAQDGCEANLLTDRNNCGACGNACVAPPNGMAACSSGVCSYACLAPYADCNGSTTDGCETDTANDVNNCGGCGYVCSFPHGVADCIAGDCELVECEAGWASCDRIDGNGCETNVAHDINNCGACGNVCTAPANAAPACLNGQCLFNCSSGFHRSDGLCCPSSQENCGGQCTNMGTDQNCSACGDNCAAYNFTVAGIPGSDYHCCVSHPNEHTTVVGCYDFWNSENNCGGCGITCTEGATCIFGVCV
jgi:hypothetical protein